MYVEGKLLRKLENLKVEIDKTTNEGKATALAQRYLLIKRQLVAVRRGQRVN